jgi:hypothetical protein
MQRALVAASILAFFGAVQPASAMMCGGGQQASGKAMSSGNSVSTGMMCSPSNAAAQSDPMADQPAQPQQQSGMCPCCRNMAMMRGGMGGGMQHHNMPGMEMPKQ